MTKHQRKIIYYFQTFSLKCIEISFLNAVKFGLFVCLSHVSVVILYLLNACAQKKVQIITVYCVCGIAYPNKFFAMEMKNILVLTSNNLYRSEVNLRESFSYNIFIHNLLLNRIIRQ